MLQHATCLNMTSSTENGLVSGIISSIQNTLILVISPAGGQRSNNKLAEKSLWQMQTWGYHEKSCPKYVVSTNIS